MYVIIFVGGQCFSAAHLVKGSLSGGMQPTLCPPSHSRVLPPPMQLQSRVARSAHVDRAFSSSYVLAPLRMRSRDDGPPRVPEDWIPRALGARTERDSLSTQEVARVSSHRAIKAITRMTRGNYSRSFNICPVVLLEILIMRYTSLGTAALFLLS